MQIITLGGGGFSMEPENPLLDKYILSHARKSRPSVCFVPTASGDSESYSLRFYDAFSRHDCAATHLSLFQRKPGDLRDFILRQDIIYVGGGNTANLLTVWRAHGMDKILREALANGVLLCGISAGSLCWFECGVTDSFGPELQPFHNGLGFISGSNCPHYDGEPQRRPTYHRLIAAGLAAGYAADDGCALHFEAGQIKRIVSSRRNAKAYKVGLLDGQVKEEPMSADYLG
jgi:peptidase E